MIKFALRIAALCLALSTVPAILRAEPPAQDAPVPAPISADARFTMEVTGTGADVILIPGLSSPRAVWDGAKAAIGGDHRLHLVQIRGYGGDDAGPNVKGPMLDEVVEQLAAYIRTSKLDHPAIVGHSMGGLIALMLADRHPDLVGKLMIVDSLPYIGVLFAPGATVEMVEPRAAMMRDAMAAGYGKPADPATIDAIAANNALKPESRKQVAAWAAAADPRATALGFYEDMTTDLRPRMAKIAAPITMVYPWSAMLAQDKADAVYRAAYKDAPHVSFVPVDDSGHFVMLDQPEAFAAALKAFVAK